MRSKLARPVRQMKGKGGTRSAPTKQQQQQQQPKMVLNLDALLGRPAVNLDTPELQRFLAGKVVLVTGAGGSIGSEICRQSMKFCPRRLVLVERAENALFEIDRELRQQWVGSDIRACVGDVCDETRVREIFTAE